MKRYSKEMIIGLSVLIAALVLFFGILKTRGYGIKTLNRPDKGRVAYKGIDRCQQRIFPHLTYAAYLTDTRVSQKMQE